MCFRVCTPGVARGPGFSCCYDRFFAIDQATLPQAVHGYKGSCHYHEVLSVVAKWVLVMQARTACGSAAQAGFPGPQDTRLQIAACAQTDCTSVCTYMSAGVTQHETPPTLYAYAD